MEHALREQQRQVLDDAERQRQAQKWEMEQFFRAQRKRIARFNTNAMARIHEARWGGDGDITQLLVVRK